MTENEQTTPSVYDELTNISFTTPGITNLYSSSDSRQQPSTVPYKSYNNDNITTGTDSETGDDESSSAPMEPTAIRSRNLTMCFIAASLYVISGVIQPILMSIAKDAGLADPTCQLFMQFYYIGPALVSISFLFPYCNNSSDSTFQPDTADHEKTTWSKILKAGGIGLFDLTAQTINYTGSSMAGPTIFAIIYSSVTVWTAVYSVIFLKRFMSVSQWIGVVIVFGGLTITGFQSVSIGKEVFHGALLVIFGSSMHALQYVMSEGIMTRGERLSARLNCSVQGIVVSSVCAVWQMTYTRSHFDELVLEPMEAAGTTGWQAVGILASVSLSSCVHSLTFFYTLKYFPGGAVSAGVGKALQAVLVFVATDWVFCGKNGGTEMCFTFDKFVSLVVVLGGVLLYSKATEIEEIKKTEGCGYIKIADVADTRV